MASHPSVFLTALQVSKAVVSNLNDTNLGTLMAALLHAMLIGAEPPTVRSSSRDAAKVLVRRPAVA
jgi:hypothetical protein